MLVARRYVVVGRVHNVGFRMFAAESAHVEGLTGWVQNQPDGSVEVFAEGDEESLLRFEVRIRRGPAGARVTRLHAEDEVPSGRSDGFTIRG